MAITPNISLRLPEDARKILEAIRREMERQSGRKITNTDAIVEAVRSAPLRFERDLAALQDSPRETLISLREKARAGARLNRPEWLFIADTILQDTNNFSELYSEIDALSWSAIYDGIASLVKLLSPTSSMLPYVASNMGAHHYIHRDEESATKGDLRNNILEMIPHSKADFLKGPQFFKNELAARTFHSIIQDAGRAHDEFSNVTDIDIDNALSNTKWHILKLAIRGFINQGGEPLLESRQEIDSPRFEFRRGFVDLLAKLQSNGDFVSSISVKTSDLQVHLTVRGFDKFVDLLDGLKVGLIKMQSTSTYHIYRSTSGTGMYVLDKRADTTFWISTDTASDICHGLGAIMSHPEWSGELDRLRTAYGR